MEKEFVNDKEAICLLISFIIGSSLILGTGGQAENDSWIAALLGIAMVVPMLLVYARIMSLYQGQDLFDILIALFGKAAGRIVGVLYIIYALHLGALVLRNFGEFMKIEALPETPIFISMLCLGIVSIIAARLGIEVTARTCTFFLPIVFFLLLVVQLLAIPQFHISYLKPVFGRGLVPILQGSFSAFSFPFAETVLFIGVFSALRTKQSPYKVFKWGLSIAGFTLVAIIVRNIGVLGNMRGSFYFPSYEAVGKIKVGDFLQRIEVTVSFVFFFGVFIKSSVCLLAASKGISKIFSLKDYRSIVIQTGLLMIYFAYIIYDSSMQMNYWAIKVYPYYAFPFQVVIPLIVWIFAEIKARKGQVNNTNQ